MRRAGQVRAGPDRHKAPYRAAQGQAQGPHPAAPCPYMLASPSPPPEGTGLGEFISRARNRGGYLGHSSETGCSTRVISEAGLTCASRGSEDHQTIRERESQSLPGRRGAAYSNIPGESTQ